MKKLILLSLLGVFLNNAKIFAQKDNFLKDYYERWEQSGKYMITVAEAMPESEYNFKPTPEEMSFAQQLMHIAAVLDWHAFSKIDGQETKLRYEDYKADGLSKQQIIDVLKREFERSNTLIKNYNPKRLDETAKYGDVLRTRRQFMMLMSDHVTHHRAQLLVYLRLKGIVPPKYWEFQ
jgi:uncharacterized damage-inducible protein DinB